MIHINDYQKFLEQMTNPNTPQGYLSTLSKKPKLKPNITNNNNNAQQKPTDEVDNILQNTEEQKQQILIKKDAIEKGLLNNIQNMEPENQKDVQTQVKDYKTQITEFDKTVKQISKLNQTLQKSNKPTPNKPYMQKSREQNKF
jgi:hypothetical protein